MKIFDVRNWYWIVAGDETRAFSSASGTYVPANDTTFVAWKSDGTLPTSISTAADLGEVLAPHRIRPAAADVLAGYLDKQAGDVVDLVQFKVLFNHENRIRALERAAGLNGNPANVTAQQAFTAVRGLL